MRIFQAIHSGSNNLVPNSQTWLRNLYEPLIDLGHDVYLFPTDEGRIAKKNRTLQTRFSQKMVDTFLDQHKKKPFDLFFSYLEDGMVDPMAIDRINETGVVSCNFSCNNVHQFYLVKDISPIFNYCLHAEKDVDNKYRSIGANPIWWPMASNPKYCKPYNIPREISVSFVGANYSIRAEYLYHLLINNVTVQAYGPGWVWGTKNRWYSMAKRWKHTLVSTLSQDPKEKYRSSAELSSHDLRKLVSYKYRDNVHGPLSDEEMIMMYSQSHISLGFLEVYDNHDPTGSLKRHLHLREFEAPMSGALYLTGYMDELTEHYIPGKEIITYRNRFELLDKINYYLNNPEKGNRIRDQGRKRALKDHTYHNRFIQLFSELSLC